MPARAYSSFNDYLRPIEEGGGGGRLFTGTPADGYACDVCHSGAEGAPLQVSGLPMDGYLPGQQYVVTLQWPATAEHVALMAEFTDNAGRPIGETALAPLDTWQPGETCAADGFPAADVCGGDPADPGCCYERSLEGACGFPAGQRGVLWVLDCGSKFARVVWTAPAAGAAGDVWFSSAMVTSDLQNDAAGDGVTLVRTRLRTAGTPLGVSSAVGGCNLSRAGGVPPVWLLFLVVVCLFQWRGVMARRRLRTTEQPMRGHRG